MRTLKNSALILSLCCALVTLGPARAASPTLTAGRIHTAATHVSASERQFISTVTTDLQHRLGTTEQAAAEGYFRYTVKVHNVTSSVNPNYWKSDAKHPGQLRPASVVAGSSTALPDCAGKPIIKPSNVVLTCADAGATANQIVWTGWGSTFAAGVAITSVNDCVPNCAAGHYHKYRVVLLADGQERCPNGQTAYARVTYAWIGRSPYPQDAPGTMDPVVRYPCGSRP